MKPVVDSIATQAVETQLIGKLRDLLSAARIIQMKPELVSKIAAESSTTARTQREQLTRKLVILQAGLDRCKKHVGRPTTGQRNRPAYLGPQERRGADFRIRGRSFLKQNH